MNTKLNLQQAIIDMRRTSNFDGLIIDQIRKDGVGSELFIEASQNEGMVGVPTLVSFCQVQTHGMNFIKELTKTFDRVDLLVQSGGYYKLRVAH